MSPTPGKHRFVHHGGEETTRRRVARTLDATAPDTTTTIYHELRHLIVSGQLAPGTRITERDVVEQFGLSRTPVRSALQRLQQERFVIPVGRGREPRLVVAPLTQADGLEVYGMVGHLEGFAARTAAQLPADRRKMLVRHLRDVNRELATVVRKQLDADRVFDLDLEFHRVLVEESSGPRMIALHRVIKSQSERYSRLYSSVVLTEIATSIKEHGAIATSIAAGNPTAAQHAAETNWYNAAARLTRIIAHKGERGNWNARHSSTDEAPAPPRPL